MTAFEFRGTTLDQVHSLRPEEYDEIFHLVTGALQEYQILNPEGPRMTAPHAHVEALLGELRAYVAASAVNPKRIARIDELTDEISTITRAYMVPGSSYDWTPFHLTVTEERYVEILYARLGRLVRKESILDAAYFDRNYDAVPDTKIVDVIICKIRTKGFGTANPIPNVRRVPGKNYTSAPFEILTEWGRGYRMVHRTAPVQTHSALQRLVA